MYRPVLGNGFTRNMSKRCERIPIPMMFESYDRCAMIMDKKELVDPYNNFPFHMSKVSAQALKRCERTQIPMTFERQDRCSGAERKG
jgi:hypothetical protein